MNDSSFQIEYDIHNSHLSQVNLLGKPKTLYQQSIDESGKLKLYSIIIFSFLMILIALFSILYLILKKQTTDYIENLEEIFQNEYSGKYTLTTTSTIRTNSNSNSN